MKRVLIIGAGPAGMTAAYELVKLGAIVEVFEASNQVGGMARTIDLWGQKVDLGPHRFFSTDPVVNRLWEEALAGEYAAVDRLTRIFYSGKFFHYPLRPFDALSNLGIFESIRCVFSYLLAQLKIGNDSKKGTFENWVVSRFGKRLFQIFFKTYSEKLWGISCQELDADFAAQRIKGLSLFGAIMNAFKGGRGNKHKTLVDQFFYPIKGSGALYEKMADHVRKSGGKIHLNAKIASVTMTGKTITGIQLQDGTLVSGDHVISTMPLTHLVNGLANVPEPVKASSDALTFRNTILVYLLVDGKNLFPDNWLYIHEPSLLLGRVTNFRNWVPSLYGSDEKTILCLEYWCNDPDPMWSMEHSALIDLATKEIRATGLIGKTAVLKGHVHLVKRCYPVYKAGYQTDVTNVANYLKGLDNLSVIGRYGSFKYNNQDHSIVMGYLAAQNIMLGKNHDLWSINTDYESYQEDGTLNTDGAVVTA